ncbi:MAG TPA: DUF2970 domain-containing protein [Pseudomonas xinjiangensis]|uniref:DUF2970 domain-containing protein n=2 Tax=root TaxID=1 RepID=A0A7V1BQJ4_9GAMM|nr:DUF2970 domain-containing protein [Halopseudomonas xinjiangensis]HEC46727.1 DUF2970 domain-containing protein [Halopseudomonas xinjiangensis]
MTGEKHDTHKKDTEGMSFRDTLVSVLFAALGVQSSKSRERDFTKGKPSHFIMLGIAFTGVFILVILGVVNLVLHLAEI